MPRPVPVRGLSDEDISRVIQLPYVAEEDCRASPKHVWVAHYDKNNRIVGLSQATSFKGLIKSIQSSEQFPQTFDTPVAYVTISRKELDRLRKRKSS